MQGFFSKGETETINASGGKIHSCVSCGLYKLCSTPKMQPAGDFEKGIMLIGDFPTAEDDSRGKHWQSGSGGLLRRVLSNHGIDVERDCLSLNAVNCAPGRRPTSTEVDHCRSVVVWKAIKEHKPRLILLFGEYAIDSVIGHRMKGRGVQKWRGWTIPDQELNAWVCPTYDPGYLLHKETPTDLMNIWNQDIQKALEKAENPAPVYKEPVIETYKDFSFLKNWGDKLGAFDYETTGLKPNADGHKIVAVSIADSEDHVYVVPAPKKKRDWQPFRKWLADSRIKKMAHNMKYEDTWSNVILRVPVRGWFWDSMQVAHILDNRRGISGLKFQNYAHFGIADYSYSVDPYLKSSDEYGGNTKNTIEKLMGSKDGQRRLLEYCALDSVYEYRLAMKQMQILGVDL